ncbi:MAG: phosphatase PAP2 family protein [Hyphomicrobiales bacterium]
MSRRRDPHPYPPHKGEGAPHFREKALLALSLLALFGSGYFGIGYLTDPGRVHDLALPLDLALPFEATWVWIYIWVIPAAVAPLFLVKSQGLYRRAILAYALTIAIACLVFLIYPVSAMGLRAQATLVIAQFSDRMVAVLYQVDPSANAFPSLHLALVTLAALAAWKASRLMGLILGLSVPMVAIAVLLVKQHFILDVVSGIVLALLIGAPLISGYRPERKEAVGYSWRGPAAFFAFAGFNYAVIALIGVLWPL